jgi:alkanesulfonate monooxygenase SsuD/methylene tetrahydromethanopterin reductase-like flavin-dependent oxidoreductase (luciferase family)
MKFGYFIRSGWSYEGMLDLAQHAEVLGLEGAYLNDHVLGLFSEARNPFLEAMTTMAAIGVQTKRIRIGHIVIFNSLRNPAYLAKTLTTLDHLTKGRLDVLLGAGWNPLEYDGYDLTADGKGMPSPGKRLKQLKETVDILHGMFKSNEFSYEGKYFKLKGAYNYPLPVQKEIPVIIGAEKPHLMRLAARHADGVNIRGNIEILNAAHKIFSKELEKVGRRREDFHYSSFEQLIFVCKDEAEYDAVAKQQAERWKQPPEYVKKYNMIGTPEVLAEKIRSLEDIGLEQMIIYCRPAKDVAEAKLRLTDFVDKVVPLI